MVQVSADGYALAGFGSADQRAKNGVVARKIEAQAALRKARTRRPRAAAAERPPREHAKQCRPELDRQGQRRARWDALRTLWRISDHKRHAFCRRYAHGEVVAIEKRENRASYSGLQTCGWPGCPLCGPKIAVERAADIALALTEHHARGGRVALLTLTMRHSRAERLRDLLDGLGGAWSAIRKNKTPRRLLTAHVEGWIKRLEVTAGPNGWHPHLHVLLFLRAGTTEDELAELAAAMFGAWSGRLVRAGLGKPTKEHGIDCKMLDLAAAHEHVAEYVAKAAALELTSAGTKIGRRAESRTPLQLLHDVGTIGLADDVARWHEYEQAMHGRAHLLWSDGLRVRLLAGIVELTDEQAAESNDGAARLLAYIGLDTWSRVRSCKPGPAVGLNWAEVYDDDDEARELLARNLAQHNHGELEAATFRPPSCVT